MSQMNSSGSCWKYTFSTKSLSFINNSSHSSWNFNFKHSNKHVWFGELFCLWVFLVFVVVMVCVGVFWCVFVCLEFFWLVWFFCYMKTRATKFSSGFSSLWPTVCVLLRVCGITQIFKIPEKTRVPWTSDAALCTCMLASTYSQECCTAAAGWGKSIYFSFWKAK